MGYQRSEVRAIASARGAGIDGVDPAGNLDNQAFNEAVQALHDRGEEVPHSRGSGDRPLLDT